MCVTLSESVAVETAASEAADEGTVAAGVSVSLLFDGMCVTLSASTQTATGAAEAREGSVSTCFCVTSAAPDTEDPAAVVVSGFVLVSARSGKSEACAGVAAAEEGVVPPLTGIDCDLLICN